MKRIREIISENLTFLRKKQGITQIELANMINYSDKAISRWENGESLPDYETLELLANIYNVDFSYLFTEHTHTEGEIKKRKYTLISALILFLIAIWGVAVVTFVTILLAFKFSFWQAYIWALPVSAILLITYNYKFYHSKGLFLISHTIFTWTLITAIYCQLLSNNLWALFLVGIPIQLAIIVLTYHIYPNDK